MIYLDCNATTPIDLAVAETMSKTLVAEFGNPSSAHMAGRSAHNAVQRARAQVAGLIGCKADEVVFTSGGTESNNLAITGTALKFGKGHIITSCIEHPSVTNTVNHLENIGFSVTRVGVNNNCLVSPGDIKTAIRDDTILITVMHSNNETGTLQPIAEIGKIADERGITFHTDAAQSVGKVPVSASQCEMLTIAGHKFYGPEGVGALYIKDGHAPCPIMYGAGHEHGLRPGTENVPGIVGLGMASEIALGDLDTRVKEATSLKTLLLELLNDALGEVRVNSTPELTLPGTLNVCIPGTDSAALVRALSGDVAISAGSACHEDTHGPSGVLVAMGLSAQDAMASIRISIGKDNTREEIMAAVKMISARLRSAGRKP